jgi:hypothetical protein
VEKQIKDTQDKSDKLRAEVSCAAGVDVDVTDFKQIIQAQAQSQQDQTEQGAQKQIAA